MLLSKEQVLERLCKLCTSINEDKFKYTIPSDCFCTTKDSLDTGNFQFDSEVIKHLEDLAYPKGDK